MATILVVDDDAAMRDTMFDILALDGHEVVLADDGNTGIKRFRDSMPDLVITDIQMPGTDGIELLEQLKTEFMGVPVIIMSCSTSISDFEEAVKSSASRVIRKPFEVNTILGAVSEMTADDLFAEVNESVAASVFGETSVG